MPRVIVALDVPSAVAARALADALGHGCDFVKIGSELFTAAGPPVVTEQRAADRAVFLDLKLHDIPNTVRKAARGAAALGVELLTVHAAGGRAMLEAAVEGAGESVGVFAVTVLTSLDASALAGAWGRPIARVEDEVLRLAELAAMSGVRGIVCSGAEAAAVHARFGERLALLVPGVRLEGGDSHDQARVVTPREAAYAGADYIVVGRAVTGAADPRAALALVRRELDDAGAARELGS